MGSVGLLVPFLSGGQFNRPDRLQCGVDSLVKQSFFGLQSCPGGILSIDGWIRNVQSHYEGNPFLMSEDTIVRDIP